ncbi:hypothetical protein C8R44DRAFT_793809 [Mycena epipterygia]|nr:hypothetical protein C8R44DRAFT_793809 [Mycena epipterygia]
MSSSTATPSRTTPAASTPPPTLTSPLSVDVLLQAHAAAPDPKLAAIEQATSERSVLTSQNARLWKLIEKQRSGYNEILKELERIRSERDGYKAKLTVAASYTPQTTPARPARGQEPHPSTSDHKRDLSTATITQRQQPSSEPERG